VQYQYKELTEKNYQLRLYVYNQMGFGFFESVYEKCLLIELRKAGLNAEFQQAIMVYYENQIVGNFVADVIVEDSVILELKFVRRLARVHETQLVNYLAATGKEVGLLFNFGE